MKNYNENIRYLIDETLVELTNVVKILENGVTTNTTEVIFLVLNELDLNIQQEKKVSNSLLRKVRDISASIVKEYEDTNLEKKILQLLGMLKSVNHY